VSGAPAGGLRLARLDVATYELVQARIYLSIHLSIDLSMYLYMHIYILLCFSRESGAPAGGLRLARPCRRHARTRTGGRCYIYIIHIHKYINIVLFLAREWRTSGRAAVGAARRRHTRTRTGEDLSIYLCIYLSMYLYMHIYIALLLTREWRTSGGTEVGAA